MASISLHKFKDDLQNAPGRGSDAPPRTIRASDLDGNFKKVTIIESDDVDPVPYELEHSEDGTRIKSVKQLPDGGSRGDLCYWNPDAGVNGTGKWIVLPAPEDQGTLHVLTAQDGALTWTATEDCD